jgi:hypothetical protein
LESYNCNEKEDGLGINDLKELMGAISVLEGDESAYGDYSLNDYHSHDGGSLYDQFEYIRDHDQ